MITVKKFSALWCAPCRMLTPVFYSLEEEMPDVKFETVDIDEHPDVVAEYGIRTVPTVLVIKDGEIKHTIIGANSKKRYVEAIATA